MRHSPRSPIGSFDRGARIVAHVRSASFLSIIVLLFGLLPSSIARSQPTQVGTMLYACTTGLCSITIGSDKAQTVVPFDPKTVSIHGYSLSLDGTKIVYALGDADGTSGKADIYLADANGNNSRKLFNVKGALSGVGDLEGYGVLGLTADNSRIIFEDNAQVFTARLDGVDRRPILKQFIYGASSTHYYQLSPQRTRLLVTYTDPLPSITEYDTATSKEYSYNLDLSLSPAAMGSDDQHIIAYHLSRPYNPNALSHGENLDIPSDGYAEVELPSLKSRSLQIPGAIMSTASNGQIVIAQTTQNIGEYKNFQLFDLASGQVTPLTLPNFLAYGERLFNNVSLVFPAPATAPPVPLNVIGEIAYLKDGDIWLLDLATRQSEQLTKIGSIAPALAWSPDGQTLAFTAKIRGNFDIYTAQADGSNITVLTRNPLDELLPSYAPDGTLLYARATPPDPVNQFTGFEIIRHATNGQETSIWNPDLGGCEAGDLRAMSSTRFVIGLSCIPDAVGVSLVDTATSSKADGKSIGDYLTVRADAGACSSEFLRVFEAVPARTQPLIAIAGDTDCATPGVQGQQLGIIIANATDPKAPLRAIETGTNEISRLEWSPDDKWLIFEPYGQANESGGLWIVSAQGGPAQQIGPVGTGLAWRPDSAVDSVTAQKWLTEKAQLIKDIQKVRVDTTLFIIPELPAYDERSAQELWNRINAQAQNGSLTREQLDAFARLTLQERAFKPLLPVYTSVAAAHTTTLIDTLEVGVGTVFALKPAWNICKKSVPLCGRLQNDTEGIIFRIMEDTGTTFATFLTTQDDREAGTRDWKFALKLVQDGYAEREKRPMAMLEMLRDTAIESAVTGVMIQPYLGRSQKLLEKGVRTADLAHPSGDRWPITGTTSRAEVNTDVLTEELNIEQASALDNYNSFQKGAGILKIAEDVADWATLSPFALIAQAVGIGARIEQIVIVSAPLTYLNLKSLDCIEYLTGRASERAFDAEHVFENCRTRTAMQSPTNGKILFVAYRPTFATPLQTQTADDADRYRKAINMLVQAVQAKDDRQTEQAIDLFNQADAALSDTLHQLAMIQFAQETRSEQEFAMLRQRQIMATHSLAVNLAVAESLLARQSGASPQNDLSQITQAALHQLDLTQQTVAQTNLAVPTDRALVVIQQIQTTVSPDQQIHMNVSVKNIGGAASQDLQIAPQVGDRPAGATARLGALNPGQEAQTILNLSPTDEALIDVQVLSGTAVLDSQLQSLPSPISVDDTALPTETTGQLTPTSTQSASQLTPTSVQPAGAIIPATVDTARPTLGGLIAIILGVILLIIVTLVLIRRRMSRSKPQ